MGLDYPFGSSKEGLAIAAFYRKQNTHFMTTLSIVNAIISVGNGLISALSEGSSTTSNGDNLKKSLESLKELLLPEDETEKSRKEKRVMDILEAEVAAGPLSVRKMGGTSLRDRGSVKRRRSDTDGRKQSES